MTKNRPEVGLERAGRFIHHFQWQYHISKLSPCLDAFYSESYLVTLTIWLIDDIDSDTDLAAHCP
jgi:hypothetical protein